jgi:diguanylate cyclase (GGDEF)-like protein
VRILIAEDDPISRRVLAVQLGKWGHEVISTQNGLEAWDALHTDDAPLVAILDWMMPGMDGVEICRRMRQEKTDSPTYIILLTAKSRKENVIEGLEAGADDYLTKPFDRHELRVRLQAGARIVELQENLRERVKELEEAIIEKEHAEQELRNLTLTDHLTGLYNHRGFFTLAEHVAKVGKRSRQQSLLIYADMDGLKQINDTLGHTTGSKAIAKLAEILQQTFRDCDIVARLGGDEFTILCPNVCSDQADGIIQRLRDNLQAYNNAADNDFSLSLSLGAVPVDHTDNLTLEEQIAAADRSMYRDKQRRKAEQILQGNNRQSLTPIGHLPTT